jgi:phage shock protein PspC (stress-responsive transcriptional regulator)
MLPLWLMVVLVVAGATIVTGLVAYLINKLNRTESEK